MRKNTVVSLLTLLALVFSVNLEAQILSSTPTISTQGKTFSVNGKRFMVRGVALSSNSNNKDLLSDQYFDYMSSVLLPKLQYLHVNTIRVYQVDPTQDHTKVMQLLADNNIYVLIGLSNPQNSINRENPTYTKELYNYQTSVVDAFAKFPNVLAFSIGNEIVFPGSIFADPNSDCARFHDDTDKAKCTVHTENDAAAVVKGLIRDIKAYMKNKNLRSIPVGVAMVDQPQTTFVPPNPSLVGTDYVAAYYACSIKSGDNSDRADYIGINSYRYGPGRSMDSYDGLANEVAPGSPTYVPVPVFLTEAGDHDAALTPRDWKIESQFYQKQLLSDNLSGEMAFQFFEKGGNLGLYDETSLQETAWGGAANLSKQFQYVNGLTPITNPNTDAFTDCSKLTTFNPVPADLGFVHTTSLATDSTLITVQNYATSNPSNVHLVVLEQRSDGSKAIVANLKPAASGSSPSSLQVKVDPAATLMILNTLGNWSMVCQVAAGSLSNNSTVMNNVSWGNVPCNVNQGNATRHSTLRKLKTV